MKYTRIFYSKESKYSHVKNNSELEGLLLLVALICQLKFMGIQLLFICTHAQLLSCSVVSDSVTPGTVAGHTPYLWGSPGKKTGLGCHFLLQGIFSTQGLNPHLLHWQTDSLLLSHPGNQLFIYKLRNAKMARKHSPFWLSKKWGWNQSQLAEVGQLKSEGKLWCISQLSSIAQSCLTLCDPMDCSMLGFLVHHQLLEPAQTHIYQVSDAIQPSHPLPSPPPPAFNLSQQQSLF